MKTIKWLIAYQREGAFSLGSAIMSSPLSPGADMSAEMLNDFERQLTLKYRGVCHVIAFQPLVG